MNKCSATQFVAEMRQTSQFKEEYNAGFSTQSNAARSKRKNLLSVWRKTGSREVGGVLSIRIFCPRTG
jgi:hypothetical protein